MKIGKISEYINAKSIAIFVLQFLMVVSFLGYKAWKNSDLECVRCHSDKDRMTKAGFPELHVTREIVEKESKHPNVKCIECHLGDGRARDTEKAHEGMLKAILIGHDGNAIRRKDILKGALLPRNSGIRQMLLDPEIRNVLWHDRDPETLGFNPSIAKKTCGKSGCHPEELGQFRKTIMATNFRQRTMRTWLEPYGPHNCGPSFADLPAMEVLKKAGFSFENTEKIAKNLNIPFTKEQAIAKQRLCNVCHTGCLDCHYAPDREKGVHNFVNRPTSISCAGYGRGTSICHPGAMQSRRGETYIGGDFSIPEGMPPDVHYNKDIHCVDCHITGEKGMGDMQRKAGCQDCHIDIEEAHSKSIHKNMDCATCHINEIRGYQITIWGPGKVSSEINPFKKYSLYYGIQSPPILIKDQKGKWIPVKIWPHSVGNIKEDVRPSEEMRFRWPEGQTKDAYYIVGTLSLEERERNRNNKHLLWFEIEQVSHPYGKARKCESCHRDKSGSQSAISEWEFLDDQGAELFKGGYKIVADNSGIRIIDMKNTTPIKLLEGYKLEDFASWIFFRDRWKMPGDFSIKIDRDKYKRYLLIDKRVLKEIDELEDLTKTKEKKIKRRFKDLKGIVLHDQDSALINIKKFRDSLPK
jgi:hypothetical protein